MSSPIADKHSFRTSSAVDGGDVLDAAFMDYLISEGRVSGTMAERVLRVQRETQDRLSAVLLKLGLLPEQALADDLCRFLGASRLDLSVVPSSPVNLPELNVSFLRNREVFILAVAEERVVMGGWDGLDEDTPRALQYALGRPVEIRIATRQEILSILEDLHPVTTGEFRLDSSPEEFEADEVDRLKDLASDAPVIRLVQAIIDQAVVRRASDIHVESTESELKIRYRLDGMLQDTMTQPKSLGPPVISRIKVMAGLNIAERRLPQDGRLRVTVQGKTLDFRVACTPSLHGESVVLRVLDRQDIRLDFGSLGFDEGLNSVVRSALSNPYGIVLVTGPTGSGKTTTLYAALQEINRPEKKILTVEDPVEYMLEGVTQVPVQPQIGLTFAHALRSFLRQDPDILMVGEVRDRETAEVAVQAALTGHLLLSTLHTNSAAAAVTRLLDMGIDDFLLTSTLHLVIGQRLVRRLCQYCREPYEPDPQRLDRMMTTRSSNPWYRAVGCDGCHGSGYAGRTAIVEALPVSGPIRTAILARQDAHKLEQLAVAEGMRTMYQHGMYRVGTGETSVEEVLRVTSIV